MMMMMTNESVVRNGKVGKRMVSEKDMECVSRSLVESNKCECMGANCAAPVRSKNDPQNYIQIMLPKIVLLIGDSNVRFVPPHSSATSLGIICKPSQNRPLSFTNLPNLETL